MSNRKGGPFYYSSDQRQLPVNSPRKEALRQEGCTSDPMPTTPVSSFFLLLLQIASRLRLCGNASLKFSLLLSTICVENIHKFLLSQEVKAFRMQWAPRQPGRNLIFCILNCVTVLPRGMFLRPRKTAAFEGLLLVLAREWMVPRSWPEK